MRGSRTVGWGLIAKHEEAAGDEKRKGGCSNSREAGEPIAYPQQMPEHIHAPLSYPFPSSQMPSPWTRLGISTLLMYLRHPHKGHISAWNKPVRARVDNTYARWAR